MIFMGGNFNKLQLLNNIFKLNYADIDSLMIF